MIVIARQAGNLSEVICWLCKRDNRFSIECVEQATRTAIKYGKHYERVNIGVCMRWKKHAKTGT